MTEHIARFKPGQNLPVFAETQLLAGRFAVISGKTTGAAAGAYKANHAGAGVWADGVVERDSAPTTYPVHSTDRHTNLVRPGAVAMVVAGAAVSVGDEVQSTSVGKAVTQTTGVALGKALTAASGDNSVIEVALYGAPGAGSPGSGNTYVEGTPQADIAAVAATATNPAAITAAAGEATAADLTLTQGLETQVSALVVDVAALIVAVNSIRLVLDEYGMTL